MVGNDRAQWLLLSSVVVSFGIVALLLLLNTAMLSGHASIESIMDFPKDKIRDLRSISLTEATIIGKDVSTEFDGAGTDKAGNFSVRYDKYVSDVKGLYERQGTVVDVTHSLHANAGSMYANIRIAFYNGNTIYMENQTVKVW
jgi:hypothetical protein